MSGPGYPASATSDPPPGQGYYHNNAPGRDDNHYDRAPEYRRGEEPPARRDYDPSDYADSRAGRDPPMSSHNRAESEYGRGPDDRSEYSRAPPSEYDRAPPSEYSRAPPSDYSRAPASEYTDYSRDPPRSGAYSRRSRSRRGSPSRSRSRSRSTSSSRASSRSRSNRGSHRRRRRRDQSRGVTRSPSRSRSRSGRRTALAERFLGHPSDPKKGGRDVFGGSEGEKGLGAALAGGAGGAWLGHELGKGTLETLAGGIAGAIAARAIERRVEKKKEEKRLMKDRRAEEPYGGQYPPPGRDMRDVRDTGRDGARGGKRRSRSQSRRGDRERKGSWSSSDGYGRD